MEEPLYVRVKAAVDAADPAGLLAIGCPPDEYEPEIRDIVARIESGAATDAEAIREVMTRWFGSGTGLSDAAVNAIAYGLGSPRHPDT